MGLGGAILGYVKVKKWEREGRIPSLVLALGDAHITVTDAAGKALIRLGAPAVAPLLEELADDGCWYRAAAATVLARIRDPRAVEPLIAALASPDDDLRYRAAQALAVFRDPRSFVALLATLEDKDPFISAAALTSLGALCDPRALPAVRTLLKHETGWVREEAARVVALLSGPADSG